MKRLTNQGTSRSFFAKLKMSSLLLFMLLVASTVFIYSCTKENELPPPPTNNNQPIVRGNAIMEPGAMTAKDSTEWKLDKAHSSVLWETNYVGASGLLTGRFNQFGVHELLTAEMINYQVTGQPVKDNSWAFYENDPSKTFFSGYVQINTSNTGEPGRDSGCNISGMGTVKIVPGTQNLTLNNVATIKTTKVEFDPLSADYIVTMNFTWQGKMTAPVTKSIVGRMKYIKKSKIQSASPYDVFGLQLSFQFNCRDFGITSTSISDKMEMECNMNFNNK